MNDTSFNKMFDKKKPLDWKKLSELPAGTWFRTIINGGPSRVGRITGNKSKDGKIEAEDVNGINPLIYLDLNINVVVATPEEVEIDRQRYKV